MECHNFVKGKPFSVGCMLVDLLDLYLKPAQAVEEDFLVAINSTSTIISTWDDAKTL